MKLIPTSFIKLAMQNIQLTASERRKIHSLSLTHSYQKRLQINFYYQYTRASSYGIVCKTQRRQRRGNDSSLKTIDRQSGRQHSGAKRTQLWWELMDMVVLVRARDSGSQTSESQVFWQSCDIKTEFSSRFPKENDENFRIIDNFNARSTFITIEIQCVDWIEPVMLSYYNFCWK